MNDKILPKPRFNGVNFLRRFMPSATHLCVLCGAPLFSEDEQHECPKLPSNSDKSDAAK